jgi:hypothetical protein
VITKPEEHEINRARKRLLRTVVEELGWVLNDVEEDYGIDSNVQIFDGTHPTGAWFHKQLKSSCHSDYSADQTFISQELSVDHARHCALGMRQPIRVIYADVTSEKIYWYFPQLDKNLATALSNVTTESIRVRIPSYQQLPDSASDVLLALDRVYLTLADTPTLSCEAQHRTWAAGWVDGDGWLNGRSHG